MLSEEDFDTFFEAFEVVARKFEWPEAKWPLLVQSVLKGKAQVAFAALDPRLGLEYEALKKAVLTAFQRFGVEREGRSRFTIVCHHCQEPGHLKPCCPLLKWDREIVCHGCRRPGHVQSQCLQHGQWEGQAKTVALVAALTQGTDGLGHGGPREVPLSLPSSYKPFTSTASG